MASAGESPPNLCYSLGNGMHVSVNAGSVEQQLAEISRFTNTGARSRAEPRGAGYSRT
jgi:hypothetical protein